MVGPSHGIQAINRVGANMMLLSQVRGAVCKSGVSLDNFKRTVRLITFKTREKRVVSTSA